MSVKIFACGDIIIQRAKRTFVDNELERIIRAADIAVCNFEGPVKSRGHKILKAGPYLEQAEDAVSILHEAGFNLFSLANNHILDFGDEGLVKTIGLIDKAGARHVGAGADFDSAYKLIEYELNSLKIGFLAFAEYGFGVLSEDESRGGYAWIEHPSVVKIIRESKAKVDYLIVEVHAGVEDVLLPLPEWRLKYKEFCDNGADIIIGHHPHLPQGFERYNSSVIFYSLGNFCFDHADFINKGNLSYSVLLEMSEAGFGFRIIWHKKTSNGIVLLDNQKLRNYSEKLNSFFKEQYKNFTNQQIVYLYNNRYKKYLGFGLKNNTIDLIKRFLMFGKYRQYKLLMNLHNSKIESHRYAISRVRELMHNNKIKSDYSDILAMFKEYSELNSL